MEKYPTLGSGVQRADRISWEENGRGGRRTFAVMLICAALAIAVFAIGGVWVQSGGEEWLRGLGGFEKAPSVSDAETDETEETTETPTEDATDQESSGTLIPSNAVLIKDVDLSCRDLGASYLHNATSYLPDVPKLLEKNVSSPIAEEPIVLILHTHTSEGYSDENADYLEGDPGEVTYTKDENRNVIAVGSTLARVLNQKGVPAIHCMGTHDESGLSGSYARSAETVRFFLEQYPSIRYVIDLHRDAILNEDGEYLRARTEEDGESLAQVMAVVGSDLGGGEAFAWEQNLAIALQLRALLNAEGGNLCRPVTLRNSSYGQNLAPYSLLLEIGTGANCVKEAERSAARVGEALAVLIRGQ